MIKWVGPVGLIRLTHFFSRIGWDFKLATCRVLVPLNPLKNRTAMGRSRLVRWGWCMYLYKLYLRDTNTYSLQKGIMKVLLGDWYLGQSRIVLHVNIPRTLMISGYIIFFNYTQSQEHITKGSRLHIHNQYYDILVK